MCGKQSPDSRASKYLYLSSCDLPAQHFSTKRARAFCFSFTMW